MPLLQSPTKDRDTGGNQTKVSSGRTEWDEFVGAEQSVRRRNALAAEYHSTSG